MDAVKFIQERGRMCATYTPKRCKGCPAANVSADAPACALDIESQVDSKKQVTIVEEWSAAHPRKTRQSVFLEQWPDADIGANGVVAISPCSFLKVYRQESKCRAPGITCDNCRREFWMQEVE